MRITKEPQSNLNIINTLRNLNKLNPSANIDLSNIHSREIINNENSNNPIKVKLMKNNTQISPQKKFPINFIYNDKKININQKEINNLRHSLIFTQEKQNDKIKENNFLKKISMSPKLTLHYEEKEEINNTINKAKKETPKKSKYNMLGLFQNKKNFAYNKKKPSNALSILSKKKEQNNPNDDNISVVSFNSVMTDINNYNNYKYNTYMKNTIEIKSEDLIMLEERLNDINISLNNINDINDVGAISECVEFFVFYFHSSLSYKFPLIFSENKRILIQSAINLKLLTIVMTYHLSMNLNMLSDIILILKSIFSLLKNNLYLFIKKVQLYYGKEYVLQNNIYFKTFNYILAKNGYDKLINENEISNLINNNCIKIAQYLSEIIIYYEDVGNNYYLDFLDLFNNISKLSEKDINNYFYNYLYSAKSKGRIPKPKMEYHPLPSTLRNNRKNNYYINNQTINNYNNININNINEYDKNYKIKKTNNDKLYIDYLKNKISPPFLPISNNNKNYTLVLDITNTLINIKYANPQGQILIPNLRPGIFSFLNSVKLLNEIEKNKKFFDFKLYKDHCTLYKNRFVKDITKLGRDIRKIIIVDDDENNFVLNKENGIKIKPFLGEENNNDTSLFELKKILILFERMGLDDVRKGIKSYEKDIKDKISMNNLGK